MEIIDAHVHLGAGRYRQLNAEGLLRQMHGAPEHLGKQARPVTRVDRVDSPDELRRQLEQAVATEDFERAAQLRDRLRRSEGGRR